MTPDEMIEVIQAYKDGKQIQYASSEHFYQLWEDTAHPTWDFLKFNYRVKQELKIYYVNIYPNGFISHLYSSKERALKGRLNDSPETIKLIEVIEE